MLTSRNVLLDELRPKQSTAENVPLVSNREDGQASFDLRRTVLTQVWRDRHARIRC